MNLQEHLTSLAACNAAKRWAARLTAQRTWDECERPDWLLWWAARTPVNTKAQIVKAACDCARLVLHLVPAGEERPRLAIEAAERWAEDPSLENLTLVHTAHAAAYAAYAAAYAAAAYAAYAAAYAADAAANAADAAYAAANAADAAYAAAARQQMRLACCEAIRKRLTIPWVEGA